MENILGQPVSSNDNEFVGICKTTDMTIPCAAAWLQFATEIVTYIPSTVKMPRKSIHSNHYSR